MKQIQAYIKPPQTHRGGFAATIYPRPSLASFKRLRTAGPRDDGKIYISTVDDALRIQTGERGQSAL